MNGRELVKAAFGLEENERTPWVPFVGCHGGFLLDVNARAAAHNPVCHKSSQREISEDCAVRIDNRTFHISSTSLRHRHLYENV